MLWHGKSVMLARRANYVSSCHVKEGNTTTPACRTRGVDVAEPLLAFLGQPQYYQKAVYKALRITTMDLNEVIHTNRFDVSGL